MSTNLWKSLLVNPVLLSATLTVSATVGVVGIANASELKTDAAPSAPSVSSLDQVKAYSSEGSATTQQNQISQVTSVSQLSDVKPTDWAFQALQSLVERYGCIAGYPDKTYRGNRALTRYEFAAGLNACLDRVNELIAAATADLVKKEDLATLQKLQEEFAAELATLRGRVDALEARTTTLEKQQFSTTTKLQGEVIFSVSGAGGNERAIPDATQRQIDALPASQRAAAERTARGGRGVDKNTTLSNRARLILNTSFTGKDLLYTRIQARNIPNFQTATGTNQTRLSYEGAGPAGNSANIDKLFYRIPIGEKGNLTLNAFGGEFFADVNTFNPLLGSDAQGTISRFGRYNPAIYRQAQGGSGATLNLPLGDAFKLSLGYLAENAETPTDKNGLFNGSQAALAQLEFKPTENIGLGFSYVRAYEKGAATNSVSGLTGGVIADSPFLGAATKSDNFGLQGSIRVTPNFVLSGWGGLTKADIETKTAGLKNREADIVNWAVGAAFPDLFGKGNMAGLIVGMPPKVTKTNVAGTRDRDTSLHLEGLYRLQLSDKVSVTPGIMVILNPEHNSSNEATYVGTVRTTFTF